MNKTSFWPQQFEIIKEIISKKLGAGEEKLTYQNIADFFGVKRGKVEAWTKGQRPSSSDLELIGRRLNLSPRWLLFGEGEPQPHKERMMQIQNLNDHAAPENVSQVCPECNTDLAGYIVPVHATIGAGSGRDHWEDDPLFQICIPERFSRNHLHIIQVAGDSMEPVIKEGAYVGIDISKRDIISGKTYAIRLPYEGLTLKKVFVDLENEYLRLKPQNPEHPEQKLPIDQREDLVVGQAVWVMQEV